MASGVFTLKQQELALTQAAWSNQKTSAVDYLVVAGGGGGTYTGGGGAGGVLIGNVPVAVGSSITVTVGGGGSGYTGPAASKGSDSVFGSVVANGGGAGVGNYNVPDSTNAGGSGGGGGIGNNSSGQYGGQGTPGQGNIGGYGNGSSSGGGGGAGNRGQNGNSSISGYGGVGIACDISGTRTMYGGGGGGAFANTVHTNRGLGGAGGGGDGGNPLNGGNGTANTGGGGGGASYTAPSVGTGGNGGSGIVIISYPDIYAAAASTTGSPTISTSGSGGISFNGSSQYLAYTTQTVLGLGTGDWTLDGWVYPRTVPPADFTFICDMRNGSNDAPLIALQNGNISFQTGVAGTIAVTSILANSWYHYAFVRNSNKLYCFLNGTLINAGGTATTLDNGSTSPIVIGARYTTVEKFIDGILTNFRIIKGTGLYTSNFTPPTTPSTVVSGTSMLLPAVSGAFITDVSGNNLLASATSVLPTWNASSPFATGLGYKNRTYTWTSSGSITF